MLAPYIEEYRSPQTPWEIYQILQPSFRDSFFLDSVQYQHPNQRYSYIGFDPFLTLVLQKERLYLDGKEKKTYPARELFGVLRKLFSSRRFFSKPRADFFTGGAVGFWSYELARFFEKKIRFRKKKNSGTPDLVLGFYKDLIVYDQKEKKYYLVTHEEKGKGFLKRARANIQKLRACFKASSFPLKEEARPFRLGKFHPEISKSEFKKIVLKAKRYIEAGDIYQANLSQRFLFEFEGSSLKLYDALRKINPSPFSAFLRAGDLEIISSSPERLIRKKGPWCETRPIAGTRGKPEADADLRRLKQELLRNEKERAEHMMLVDLERNDLGKVCDYQTVKVEEMLKVEQYSHVIHLVSKVVGRLSKGKDAFDLIRAMFPGGTITGCPKIRCMEIIDELEPVRRGIYTGSVGYLDFSGDLDLNIVIRTMVLNKNQGCFQTGAGIVYDSDPEREYEETLHKGEALAGALVRAAF